MGVRWFPLVGWAERGGYLADGHGNSVPRFHVTWGTGPAVVAPFERRVRDAASSGLVGLRFRHRVDELTLTGGAVDGVRGAILEPSQAARGTRSSRTQVGEFELHAPAVIVTSGGIGGNFDLVRENWPDRLGPAPERMISGVPEHVDGRMLAIAERAGGRLVNRDRMWHYTEGIQNWDPIWARHGIRILPGPSSLWFDARGQRFPAPHFPGFDTLGTLAAIRATGFAIRNARRFRGDRLARTAAPHKILDPKAGPLIAVRLNILTRKTLGGLQTCPAGCSVLWPARLAARRVARRLARFRGCSRRGRWPGSAEGGCTDTGRWRVPSSAAACSADVRPAGPRPA